MSKLRKIKAGSRISFLATLFVVAAASASAVDPPKMDVVRFKEVVHPVLQQACVKCHGAEKPKGDFRIDTLNPDMLSGPDAAKWEEVLNQMQSGAMPPKSEKPLGKDSREMVTAWLNKEMVRAAELKASTGGRGVIRRLTRYEYNYTLQDLLDLPVNVTRTMPEDRADPTGLKNNGQHLGMSTDQLEMYLEATTAALKKAMVAPKQPAVYHRHFDAAAGNYTVGIASNQKVKVQDPRLPGGARLPLNAVGQFRLEEAPRSGRFRLRIVAGGEGRQEGQPPRLQVWYGYQSTAKLLVRELIAEINVDAPLDKPKDYDIYGYLEECPQSFSGSNKRLGVPIIFLMQAHEAEKSTEHQPAIFLKSIDLRAPYFESWPPESRTAVLGGAANMANPAAAAAETLKSFASRAWRRPVTSRDVAPFLKTFEKFYKANPDYDAAMRDTLAMILMSPKFLYLAEPIGDERRSLTAHELASRLSYFLWCSLPDADLRKDADSGDLLKDTVLAGHVRRMLADPKARRFVQNFTEQWLSVHQVDSIAVNPEYHPRFSDNLKKSLRQEPIELFWHILTQNRSAMEFLSSDYVVVNEALAAHYGLKGVAGPSFRPVKVRPEDHRGGVLTMGCFMLANSDGAESHPIKRGKWLLTDLMNEPPPAPPPDVPELGQIKDFAKLSLTRQLEIHRSHAACASCHDKLDPWGLALENLNAVGQWRTNATKIVSPDGQKPGNKRKSLVAVDATAKLPDGTVVNGVDELKQYCVRVKGADFARALTRKVLAYSLGRSLEWTDRADVDKLAMQFAESDYKLQNLITEIALSHSFRTR